MVHVGTTNDPCEKHVDGFTDQNVADVTIIVMIMRLDQIGTYPFCAAPLGCQPAIC